MARFTWLLIILLSPVLASAQWDATDYTISFSSNVDQESVLRILIHQECARLISASQAIQTYCVENAPPAAGTCTCTPTATQKRTFLTQRYLAGGFTTDRNQLYRSHGREVGNAYATADKATRDIVDNALGLGVLP